MKANPLDNRDGDYAVDGFFRDPHLPFLKEVKKEMMEFGHLYDETEPNDLAQRERLKLPRLIFRNYSKSKNGMTAARKHEIYQDRKRIA